MVQTPSPRNIDDNTVSWENTDWVKRHRLAENGSNLMRLKHKFEENGSNLQKMAQTRSNLLKMAQTC
jgi:hypothetical protein